MMSWFKLLFVVTVLLVASGLGEVVCEGRQADIDSLLPPYVDAFGAPTASIELSFPGIRKVKLGEVYPMNLTQESPTVLLQGTALTGGKFYSLVTVDPDVPSPENRTFSSVLHFLVTNIPGSIGPNQDVKFVGDVVDPWIPPTPPNGTHRYMSLLFDQGYRKHSVPSVSPLEGRAMFSVRNFSSTFSLGFPIGGNLFRVSASDVLDQ